jgi:hypothetical protein
LSADENIEPDIVLCLDELASPCDKIFAPRKIARNEPALVFVLTIPILAITKILFDADVGVMLADNPMFVYEVAVEDTCDVKTELTTCITLPTGALASGNEPVKGCVPKLIPVVPFIVNGIVFLK